MRDKYPTLVTSELKSKLHQNKSTGNIWFIGVAQKGELEKGLENH